MMGEPVVIVGLGAEGLSGASPRAVAAIRDASWIAGGARHLRMIGATAAETFPISDNVVALIERLAARSPGERCVVLATGDPLFFGIGHRISESLGPEQVRVEPAVSGIQLAFARVGLSWQDAAIASVHGRPLKPVLLPLLGRPRIGLFTRDGDSPSEVARFFLDRGLPGYDAWVCENLNAAEEAVRASDLSELVGRRFADLNVLILSRRQAAPDEPGPADPGLCEFTDGSFARPATGPVLLTHEDVRSLVVRRFRGLGAGPIWDLGAGLGGVSVELAHAFPGSEVVSVEFSPERVGFLKINRARFGAWNIRVVEGEAPGCLEGEEPPIGIFLGGSGRQLGPILDLIAGRLRPGGRLVANFVGLENLVGALDRLGKLGWGATLTNVQIARGQPLAGLTTLVPLRPVWVVRADRPEG